MEYEELKMKILVMSDSHNNTEGLENVAQKVKPDMILHLGDHVKDAHKLQRLLPQMTIHAVRGNCDFQPVEENELLLSFAGAKVFMTHGHNYDVKNGLSSLIRRAKQQKADLALFGHTHQALLQQEDGLWLMNPGHLERYPILSPASYGVVNIESGKLDCQIFLVEQEILTD